MKTTTIFVRDASGETARMLRRLLLRAYKVLRVETRTEVVEGMKHHVEEFGVAKPDPRIFHAALDQLQIPAQKTWMVGDHLAFDIAGSQRLVYHEKTSALFLSCSILGL